MERPEKIYLDDAIEISGTKVNHTPDGLKYLIEHYRNILSFPVNEAKIKSADRQHIEKIISTYSLHLKLYEHEREAKANVQSGHVQENQTDDLREKATSGCVAQLHDNGNGDESG